MDTINQSPQPASNNKVLLSALLIAAGLLLLAFNLNLLPPAYKHIVFSWPSLILLLGLVGLLRRKYIGAITLLAVGGILMMRKLGVLDGSLLATRPFWPILLVIFGLVILLKPRKKTRTNKLLLGKSKRSHNQSQHNTADYIEKNLMFNKGEYIVFSNYFTGGDINLGFGDIRLDLRKISGLSPDNHLQANVMFGNIEILLPPQYELNLKSHSMFGNIEDGRMPRENNDAQHPSSGVVHITAECFFGNIRITE